MYYLAVGTRLYTISEIDENTINFSTTCFLLSDYSFYLSGGTVKLLTCQIRKDQKPNGFKPSWGKMLFLEHIA